MILIDKPFVSEFLVETIRENNFPVIATTEARDLLSNGSLNWITEEEAKRMVEKNPNGSIYTNSENSINWIEQNFRSSNLPNQIGAFKNKIKFRELLKDSFPNFFFKEVKYENLKRLNVEELKFPFIIKPVVGFFSIAVHKVDNASEWNHILEKIESEIDKNQGQYPKAVVDSTDFIIEECIEGEEYAIDCYFNNQGKPILLNILHHLFSSSKDVSDRVYSTSQEIIEKYQREIQDFLGLIGEKAKLKNFPAHVEVRIDDGQNVVPIEVNPLRYGGWCTTGDLTWYAYGFNSYEYFLKCKEPNWEDIFNTRENKKYNIIVLDNNSGINENEIKSFDYEQLLQDFQRPLSLRKVDFKKFPVFGFLFCETIVGNDQELNQILTSNLRKYIKTK